MDRVIALFSGMLMFVTLAQAAQPQLVEIEVTGMSCPFCVRGTEQKLEELPGVASAEVSLESGKAIVHMKPGEKADPDAFREAITDAGFAPGEVRVQTQPAAVEK
ncbi:MAG: heavy-metal-associated domain-containing protein [Thiogranum sp.]